MAEPLFSKRAGAIACDSQRKHERNSMENDEKNIAERLEAATACWSRTLSWLEERQGALSGEVEKISATVEQGRREAELAEKLAAGGAGAGRVEGGGSANRR